MKKLILTGIVTALAGFVMAGSAAAQTYSFDVPANAPSGATGSYHIIFTVTGSTSFDITAYGNPDGNVAPNVPIPGSPAKENAQIIGLQFLDGSFATVNVVSGTGGIPAPGNWTVGTGSSYTALALPGPQLDKFGANTFHGSVNIANSSFKTVNIGFQDGAEQWFLPHAVVTPEASSLALLLPGLAPLGLILRKRRQNRS